MKKSPRDSFVKKPEYPGGKTAQRKFIKDNLVYPKQALKDKVEGKVYLSFRVDHNGKVGDVRVLRSLGSGCDEEAVRIVSMMAFSPQKNRGSRVSVSLKIAISFRLPAPPKPPPSITYDITPSKKEATKAVPAKPVITYTIRRKKN